MRKAKATTNYKVIHRKKGTNTGGLVKFNIPLPNVKSLAKFLNGFVKRNPETHIIACYIVDNNDMYVRNVSFLQSEYSSQRWLTGYKERLLANAIEIHGMDLKWNSGLQQTALVVRN